MEGIPCQPESTEHGRPSDYDIVTNGRIINIRDIKDVNIIKDVKVFR